MSCSVTLSLGCTQCTKPTCRNHISKTPSMERDMAHTLLCIVINLQVLCESSKRCLDDLFPVNFHNLQLVSYRTVKGDTLLCDLSAIRRMKWRMMRVKGGKWSSGPTGNPGSQRHGALSHIFAHKKGSFPKIHNSGKEALAHFYCTNSLISKNIRVLNYFRIVKFVWLR